MLVQGRCGEHAGSADVFRASSARHNVTVPILAQEVSGGVQLVSAPTPPPGLSEEGLAQARQLVHRLLQHQREADRDAGIRMPGSAAELPGAAWEQITGAQQPTPARAESIGSGAAEGGGAAAVVAVVSDMSGRQASDCGGAVNGQQAQQRLVKGRATRAALLGFKQGDVSRHNLLLKVATARALEQNQE